MTARRRALLGDVITRRDEWVEISPTVEYQLVTVRLHGNGIVGRARVLGSELAGTRRRRIRREDLLVARIDARHGAIGLVPATLDGAVVSNDFVPFTIDRSLCLPQYAEWLSRTESFVRQCQMASEGTTNRVRLSESRFLDIEIPLPNLDEQRQLVSKLDAVASAVSALDTTSGEMERLCARLAINLAHRPDLTLAAKLDLGWSSLRFGEVATQVKDPVPVEASAEYANVGVYSFAKGLFAKPPIAGALTSAALLYRIRTDQFIYSRLFAFEGAYAVVAPEFDGWYVSNEFPTFDLDTTRVLAPFVLAYFSEPTVWREVAAGSVGLGDRRQRVHPATLLERQLTVPPLPYQRELASIAGRSRVLAQRVAANRSKAVSLLPPVLRQVFDASGTWRDLNGGVDASGEAGA